MDLLSVIRRWHFRQEISIWEIKRRTGLSRNTIRKYLRSDAVEPSFKVPVRPSKLDPFASYRDTFRLLFAFAQGRLRRPPSKLSLTDLDAPFICAFLDDLEMRRSATARTRNLRLTAIRSFFRYASFEAPAHSAHIQRVLAIPTKRCDKRQLHFLTRIEIDAILARPDQSTWLGRRDYALLLLAVQTGLRLSELVGLDRQATLTTAEPVRSHLGGWSSPDRLDVVE